MSDELQLTPPIVDEALVETRRVYLAMPWYKTAHPKTVFSLLSIWDRRRMAASLDFGDAAIWHSRNKLADHFLKSGLEWQFTCDDDMIFPMGNSALFNSFTGLNLPDKFAGRNVLTRLLESGKTLIGVLYFGRWKHGLPVYAEGASDKAEEAWVRRGPHDIVKPTRWVGTGGLLIHRSVYLDIEKKFPALARKENGSGGQFFSPSEHDLVQKANSAKEILSDPTKTADEKIRLATEQLELGQRMSGRNSGLGAGEDVTFCRRALQSGHQPFVDCGCIAGHAGESIYGPGAQ